jgi:hypothetical protein
MQRGEDMKRIIGLLMAILLITQFFVGCKPKHYDENNIDVLYSREWIIGKTRQEIQQKYGKFKREFKSDDGQLLGAYYVNYDTNWLDPSYIHDTYFIVFNDNNIAIDAYFRKTSIGG